VLEVGITDPDNIEALDALNFISSKSGLPYKVFLISEKDYESVLEAYKGLSGEVSEALTDLEGEISNEVEKVADEIERVDDERQKTKQETEGNQMLREDAPVTKIVATILRYAVEGNASDVHIEVMEKEVRVRFRVDGVLNTSLMLPIKVHRAVVARIKILSQMRLDEKRKPQDGRFSATVLNRRIDFRVSTFPSYYGEKVVMRILDTERGVLELEQMGLTGRNLRLVKEAIKRPYGMILVSGPTGSGKTTTLYSMLNLLDREKKNVLSLEDPVEYNIAGMNQSQIRPDIGYTFANGLRTTLRQDPDIIMVGEIRDKETAQLAIQAALTGHLVLSTIHTNDAVGVIPRLIDMGVDPYLIAPTLLITIGQRLVRTLCPGTGRPIPVDGSVKVMIDKQFEDLPEKVKAELEIGNELYEAESTPDCPNGTRGRTGVFEVLHMDDEVERIVLSDPRESDIYKAARAKGMLTMKEDAIMKSFRRLIPFEEVNTLGKELLGEFGDEGGGQTAVQTDANRPAASDSPPHPSV
jgi:type IV pilus assembly protein PilB